MSATKIFIAALIGFLLGLAVSSQQDALTTLNNIINKQQVKQSGFCPPPELVRQNTDNQSNFESGGLSWSFEYLSWKPPEKIQFDQAFYYPKTQSISCNYTWSNPEKNGKLWLRVVLNAESDMQVKRTGTHWGESEDLFICVSGSTKTCGFAVYK